MKIAGVIAEYNPFHAGHAYHLQKVKEASGCDFLAVCMAGNYTQRGEAACLNKWDRAWMALTCGADAVFELPALYAVRTADVFAMGGVSILDGLGADVLSFGSECGDAAWIERLAELRLCEPEAMGEAVRKNLDGGMSHARAWGCAAAEYLGVEASFLQAPNLILGAEYACALRKLGSQMEICPIERKGNYHGDALEGDGFASASAIRRAMGGGRADIAAKCVPEAVRDILKTAPRMHQPDDLLLDRLRTMSEADLTRFPDVGEGLERRAKQQALTADGRESWIEAVKCKRYTRARLSRLAAHVLLGLTSELADRHPAPEYARLIGMRADARPLLAELKRRSRLPIVSDGMKLKGSEVFALECRATDLRALQCALPEDRRAGQEWTRKFVRVEAQP